MQTEIKRKLEWQYSYQIDFKINNVIRDKESYYIMIKGSIQEDITIINVSAPNIGAPKYIRQMLTTTKRETSSKIIIVGDCVVVILLLSH